MIHSIGRRAGLPITLAAAACLAGAPVLAQSMSPQTSQPQGDSGAPSMQMTPQQPQPEVDVSDSELSSFVDAAMDVRDVATEWQAEATSTEDPSELEALRSETQKQIIDSIEEKGLTVNRYNEIQTALQYDPDLRERVSAEIESSQ